MTDLFAAVGEAWAEQGIGRGPAVSPGELDAWEARHGRTLTADVREYFLALNGFDGGKEGLEDYDHVTFRNLSELRPYSDEWPGARVRDADSCFAFADNLLWGSYALRLRPGLNVRAEVVMVAEPRPQRLAASFREFMEGYLRSEPDMLFWMPRAPLMQRIRRARRIRALFARIFIPDGEIKPRLRNGAAITRRMNRFLGRLKRDHPHLCRRTSGTVVLRMRVDERGRVDHVRVVKPGPIPQFANEAVYLTTRMKFSPARVNRRRVPVLIELPLSFYFPL